METTEKKLNPKLIMAGLFAFLGILVVIGILNISPGSVPRLLKTETQKNVTVDLPFGGKALVGEIQSGGDSIVFSNIVMDVPYSEKQGTEKQGTIERVSFSGMNADNIRELKKVGRIEVANLHFGSLHVDSVIYDGLELDFSLLSTMDFSDPKPDDMKRLLESFRLKQSDIQNFRMETNPNEYMAFSRTGARNCTATHTEDFFIEGMKSVSEGITVSVEKSGVKNADLPNILRTFSNPAILNGNAGPEAMASVFDGMKIRDAFIDKLVTDTDFGTFTLDRFSFDIEDDNHSGNVALKIKDFEIPAQAFALLGPMNIWTGKGNMRINSNLACDFREKDNAIVADQQASLSMTDFLSMDYKAVTRFNLKNSSLVNEKAVLVLKDKGMVASLPFPAKMALFAQGMQVDPAVGKGIQSFLENPGQTMTVKVVESDSGTNINVDVD